MQDKSESAHKGMMRWTTSRWGVCYQDDVARVVIPQLLKCLFTGERAYLKECTEALDFLFKTTGTDGTRVSMTHNIKLTEEDIDEWVYFFKHGAILDDFKSPGILLAAKKLSYLTMDEKERRAYDDYLAYLGYEFGVIDTAKSDGQAE